MLQQSAAYWLVLFSANLPLFLLGARLLFGTWRGLWETVRTAYTLVPDISVFGLGEWAQRLGSEFKLFSFVAACLLVVGIENLALVKLGLVAGF